LIQQIKKNSVVTQPYVPGSANLPAALSTK
jgi:hypothetical protein